MGPALSLQCPYLLGRRLCRALANRAAALSIFGRADFGVLAVAARSLRLAAVRRAILAAIHLAVLGCTTIRATFFMFRTASRRSMIVPAACRASARVLTTSAGFCFCWRRRLRGCPNGPMSQDQDQNSSDHSNFHDVTSRLISSRIAHAVPCRGPAGPIVPVRLAVGVLSQSRRLVVCEDGMLSRAGFDTLTWSPLADGNCGPSIEIFALCERIATLSGTGTAPSGSGVCNSQQFIERLPQIISPTLLPCAVRASVAGCGQQSCWAFAECVGSTAGVDSAAFVAARG